MISEEKNEATLTYQCPLCKKSVKVGEHRIGETIDCPACDRPFELVPPKAHPIPAGESDDRHVIDATDVADTEAVEHVIHPVILRRHFVGTVLNLLLLGLAVSAAVLAMLGQAIFGFGGASLWIAGGVVGMIALFFLTKWLLESRLQSLKLTNERLIYRYGIVQRETSEIRHDDVRNVKVDQNIAERLLNFGDIAISSAGQDDMEIIINDIPSPQSVVEYIRKRQ